VPLVAVIAVAAVLIAVLPGGGGGSRPRTTAAPASAATEVTATSGAGISAVRTVGLGGAPGGITAGASGAVWVSLPDRGALVRVSSRGRSDRFSVAGRPGALAAGVNGVWVAGSAAGRLARLDLATGATLAAASLPAVPVALTVDGNDGSAWAAGADGTVTHVGADGAAIGSPAAIGATPKAIGWGEGWVWAATGSSNSGLRRVPQGSGSPRSFDGGPGPVGVGFDSGVWLANANGHVTRFDPRPAYLRVVADVPVGAATLDAIAADEDRRAVWALSRGAQTVYRISIASERVTGRVSFASAPVALALSGRYVWVATADGRLTELIA
jgi:virginiamycin B lyase